MIYGYVRISKKHQSPDRQIRNIKNAYPDAVIVVEEFTGTRLDRPKWMKIYRNLKSGDMVVYDEVSRMSRDEIEGFELYKDLYEKEITLVFLKEPHINTDSYKKSMEGIFNMEISSGDSSTDDLVNSILSAINKFMMNKVENDIKRSYGDDFSSSIKNRNRISQQLYCGNRY